MKPGGMLEVDEDIGAVVVGFDREVNYFKIQTAQLAINELGAEFIATNRAVTKVHGAFKLKFLCAQRVEGVLLNISAKFWQIRVRTDEGLVTAQATNLDAVTHLTDAQEWAGNGAMVGHPRGGNGLETSRGDAAAATGIFRGDESRRRRGGDVEISWR